MNVSEYNEELIRRGPFGGTSIKKSADIFTYSPEGRVIATKKFWVRNVAENGAPEQYLAHIDNEIEKGKERCLRSGKEKLGESSGNREAGLHNANEYAFGMGVDGHAKNKKSDNDERSKNMEVDVLEEQLAHDIGNSDNTAIQSLLKKTMAGSMREVIKDELQAWLGMKIHQSEGNVKTYDLVELQEEEMEGSEVKECEEADKGEEETPTKERGIETRNR